MTMDIRRVLKFNKTLGVTIPRKYAEKIAIHWREFVEVFLVDNETVGIKKHNTKP